MFDQQPHHQAGGMPAAGNHATEGALGRALRVDVEGLRIELAAKVDDRRLIHRDRAVFGHRARRVVLEVTLCDVDGKIGWGHDSGYR